MNDTLVSIVRTLVPIAIGALLAAIVLDDNRTVFATAAIIAGYYLALRLAERRWPRVGYLLGTPRQPTYGPSPDSRGGRHHGQGPGSDVGQRYGRPYTS